MHNESSIDTLEMMKLTLYKRNEEFVVDIDEAMYRIEVMNLIIRSIYFFNRLTQFSFIKTHQFSKNVQEIFLQ